MEITVKLKGVAEALETLRTVGKDSQRATGRALTEIKNVIRREARANAPISPTRTQLNRQRKTRRRVRRKARATSRPSPGGLTRSVEGAVEGDGAVIFVAANSPAGKYAYRIHELKGQPRGWNRRGPGTVAKGSRADEKFITRAIADNEGNIVKIIKAAHRRAGWYELR